MGLDDVAVLGVGMTRFGVFPEKSIYDLAREADRHIPALHARRVTATAAKPPRPSTAAGRRSRIRSRARRFAARMPRAKPHPPRSPRGMGRIGWDTMA